MQVSEALFYRCQVPAVTTELLIVFPSVCGTSPGIADAGPARKYREPEIIPGHVRIFDTGSRKKSYLFFFLPDRFGFRRPNNVTTNERRLFALDLYPPLIHTNLCDQVPESYLRIYSINRSKQRHLRLPLPY